MIMYERHGMKGEKAPGLDSLLVECLKNGDITVLCRGHTRQSTIRAQAFILPKSNCFTLILSEIKWFLNVFDEYLNTYGTPRNGLQIRLIKILI